MKSGELSINWRYSANRRQTTCMVSQVTEGGTMREIASVTINRFYKDQFEYEKARKVSMKRVLEVAGLNREQRAQIWNSYFARKKSK